MITALERLIEVSLSPHYWGIHTSLYSSLPPEAIQHLERAIWLKIAGLAKEARATFENELRPFATVPVVAIEHADLELEAGKWGRAWRILDSKLIQLQNANVDLEAPEHRLMALTWAMLGTRHRGDVTSSALEIERTQHWLADVPVADYTDIQASCIRRYVIASLFTSLYSGYKNAEAEHIPAHDRTDASGLKMPWGGLQLLRRSLTQHGRFNEANALFRVELNRTPLEDRGAVVEEFLKAIAGIPPSRGRDFFEAAVRLQWATTNILLQAPASAVEEFDKSASAFQMFCDDFGIKDKEVTPHMQAMEYERLSCIDDPISRLARTEELATRMEAMDGTKTGLCLSAAADLAMAYYKATAMESFKTTYFDVQRRLETYDQMVSEDICDLVHHHVDLISVTCSGLVDRYKALEWIEAFFEEYQHFKAPAVRALLCRSKASLLRSLRRLHEADKVDEEASRLEACEPLPGKWTHMRQGYPAPTAKSTTASDIKHRLRTFLRASSQHSPTHTATEDEADQLEGGSLDIKYHTSFANDLTSALAEVLKKYIEYFAGCELSWWPLANPEYELHVDHVRVYSVPFRSSQFYDDIPRTLAESLFPNLRIARARRSQLIPRFLRREAVYLHDRTLMYILWHAFDHRCKVDLVDQGRNSQSRRQVNLTTPTANSQSNNLNTKALPAATSQSSSVNCQIVPPQGDYHPRSQPNNALNHGTGAARSASIEPEPEPVLFLSISVNSNESIARAIQLGRDDKTTFYILRREYRRLYAKWLWKHITGVKFYRFDSFLFKEESDTHYIDLHRDEERYPGAPDDGDYCYKPQPWPTDMPFPRNEVWHYLNYPEDCGTSAYAQDMLPVRIRGNIPSRTRAFGMHLETRHSILAILLPSLVATLPFFALSGWFIVFWLDRHPNDLQNAAVPANFVVAALGLVLNIPITLLLFRWTLIGSV